MNLPPDPEGQNDDRAEWARQALETFAATTGLNMDGETPEAIGDLLANIMHFCDRNGLDFDERLANARFHYDEETQDDT